jgi:integrase
MPKQIATGALIVVPAKAGDGLFWEAKWRHGGRQIKRRLGPAWIEERDQPLEGADGWQRLYRKRRGRPTDGFLTAEGALQAMRDRIAEHAERQARRTPQNGRMRFEDAASAWLDERKAVAGWKPTTERNYRAMLAAEDSAPRRRGRAPRARLMREFRSKPIDTITVADVRAFLRKLDTDPALNPRSVNAHRQVLGQILEFAVSHGWIDSNPVKDTPKRRESDPAELIVFSPEQVHAIARQANDDTIGTLIVTAAMTGLRLGELLELRWRDVRFAEASIHVQRSYSAGLGVTTPKGRRGRSVPMSDQVAGALERLSQRDFWTKPGDLIFCGRTGGHLDPTTVRQKFSSARDGAAKRDPELPRLRFHDLRHTFGSLCAAGGIDVVAIQSMMGHSNIRTTMRYLHHRPHAEAAARLSRIFTDGSDGRAADAVPAAA